MTDAPRDKYERYYAEKLWEMIPSIYRHEDGIAQNPGVLRALVEIVAEQAAILRRSHDRLWDDQFIELCDDWVVPYLGDLVATRLVSALNPRGRRVDVAKTIYYRRRKGTLRVLEELISDIAGWDGTVVECFRRLTRFRHGLDPQPSPLAGRLTHTMPGGWADLRHARAAELVDGPFDEFHRTVDVRRHRGLDGRFAIPKLAFYLYRLRAFEVRGVTPLARAGGGFSFDPSGRDVPLFMPRGRASDWDDWRAAREWELPSPIPCRLLDHAEYTIQEALILELVDQGLDPLAADDLRTLRGVRFASEGRLREMLELLDHSADILLAAIYERLLAGALVEECGKHALMPDAVAVEEAPGATVPPERTVAGNLEGWTGNAPGKRVVIDPERGRFLFIGGPPGAGSTASYHYGFAGEIGAGTYDRLDVEDREPVIASSGGGPLGAGDIANNGVAQIDDSATYGPISDKLSVQHLTLQAANGERPYLLLASNWVLNTGANDDADLLLDGLWLGSQGDHAVVLRGDYERVTIVHSTFDPGGEDRDGNQIRPVPLVIEAQVEQLTIASAIMGPIYTRANGKVEQLTVRDSILQSTAPGTPALVLPRGEVALQRVTVFGGVDVNVLWATEALITAAVDVTNTQAGCFRFSAAPIGSRVPRAYESFFATDFAPFFTSQRFGHPGYGQLSQSAPQELLRGAETGSEIGAFGGLLNPIKFDSLRAKVDEYLPFGLIPVYIYQT
jgi:hypothetical protein